LSCFRLTIVDEKAMNITYSECVPVALGIQGAMRMRHIVPYGLPGSKMFFPHFLTNGTIFGGGSYCLQNVCFDLLYNFCLKNFSFLEEMRNI
jgi:hypothetical protein